MGSHTVHNHWM